MPPQNLVKTYRDRKGMTQKMLAEKLHISRTHLSFIETGKALPDEETLKKITSILEISPLDIYSSRMVRLIMEDDNV